MSAEPPTSPKMETAPSSPAKDADSSLSTDDTQHETSGSDSGLASTGSESGAAGAATALVDGYFFRLPRAYMYADYIWPGLLMSPARHQEIEDFDFRPSDILICSYPKSGTTWVSEVVSLIVHGGDVEKVAGAPLHERVPWLEMDNDYVWVKAFWVWQVFAKALGFSAKEEAAAEAGPEVPRVLFTHLPFELLPSKAVQGVCKIIYVARNPKDNAVSFFHFHQMARFLGQQRMDWDEWFALYATGKIYCGSWFEHVKGFWKLAQVNKDRVLFLKYEDMKEDLGREVSKMAAFIGAPLSGEAVERTVAHCSFAQMKDNRMANRDGVWLFNQAVSKFMRKGVVGDWENYFRVAQSRVFDELYAREMADVPGLTFRFHPNEETETSPEYLASGVEALKMDE